MLRASRLVRNSTRGFATASAAGPKVVQLQSTKPTASVTVLLNAGSRQEAKPGVAHVLSNFAFKSNVNHSALGSVRQAELYGGVISSTLTREHLALTAEFLPGDEAFFIDLLASHVAASYYHTHELHELVLPTVLEESRAAAQSSVTATLELAHAIAFRRGLGNSLFAGSEAAHNTTTEDIVKLHAQGLQGLTLATHGLDPTAVQQLFASSVQAALDKAEAQGLSAATPESILSSSAPTLPASTYFGGAARAPLTSDDGTSALFLGFGTTDRASFPALQALAAHLSPTPTTKWSLGTGPLAGKPAHALALPYSDAALFGVLVLGTNPTVLRDTAAAAVDALKVAAGGLSKEAAGPAIAKARFRLLGTLEDPIAQATTVGKEALVGGLEGIDAAGVSKVAEALLKSKPTFVALGEHSILPYPDEVGLSA